MYDKVNLNRISKEHQARRKFVLDAARKLFMTKGVEKASMDDIAAAAEYTRRTLYAYFKSRDEIYLLILIEDLKNRWAMQKKAIASADTGLTKILVWGKSLHQFVVENPYSIRLQAYWDFRGIEPGRISDEIFAAFEAINDELADGLREIFNLGVRDGTLRPDLKIDMCISHYIYTLRSVINRALADTYSFARFNPEDYVNQYLELFAAGIRNTGGTLK